MNSVMANLIARLAAIRNQAIVIVDDRPRGGRIQISTIQLAMENPVIVNHEESPQAASIPRIQSIEKSILKSSKKTSSKKKKVAFSSNQIVKIDEIDERMKIPMEYRNPLTLFTRKYKTPIRMKAFKPRPLSFTDSNDKKKKTEKFVINDNVNLVRGEWNASRIQGGNSRKIYEEKPSRIPKPAQPKKLPARVTKFRKFSSPKATDKSPRTQRTVLINQENLLKAKGVKLNRRFELMMENLVKKSEKVVVKRKTM